MLKCLIETARGLTDADLVIKNAQLVNVLSEEIYTTDIAITNDMIVGLGKCYKGKQEIDANGAYVVPSFIDGHVHLESSMMLAKEFASAVLPTGTTCVVTDPHEIANVLGINGINFMMETTKNIGLDVYFTLPSCVPASPFETSGYVLSADALALLIENPRVLGLAEMMNYVGVINSEDKEIAKLEVAQKCEKRIDGHAPKLCGKDLCAYVVSGIKSDHECTSPEEALEKMRLGLNVMIREGSAARDLDSLIPLLKQNNTRKCIFVTDDRHPTDLKEHINGMVRRVVEAGVDPIKAIQCASLNTAEYFGLKKVGAVAPGYKANLLILPDLKSFKPHYVVKDGKIVAKDGVLTSSITDVFIPSYINSINIEKLTLEDFVIIPKSNRVKAIEIIPEQLITKETISEIKIKDNNAVSNLENDTLKICVIERHHAFKSIGKGFIKGFNLKSGAIASTVAHDSHNMIVIGTNDNDMFVAAQELIKCGGGKIVVNNGEVVAKLALPIAGLISDKTFVEVLDECYSLNDAIKIIGSDLENPFMTMAFLSLSVIPDLKITDKGVFSAKIFDFIDIFDC